MTITLKSGRVIRANGGIIGLSPELGLSEGYDGTIAYPVPDWETDEDETARYLTSTEARELAEIMIARWTAFLNSIPRD